MGEREQRLRLEQKAQGRKGMERPSPRSAEKVRCDHCGLEDHAANCPDRRMTAAEAAELDPSLLASGGPEPVSTKPTRKPRASRKK